MRKGWKIALGIVLALAVTFAAAFGVMGAQTRALEVLDFAAADPAALPDGVYSGSAQTLVVKAEVEVAVKDGKINAVTLLRNDNGQGQAAEAVTGRMVEENRIDVDVVSGATTSSLVIKAAALDALARGGR